METQYRRPGIGDRMLETGDWRTKDLGLGDRDKIFEIRDWRQNTEKIIRDWSSI